MSTPGRWEPVESFGQPDPQANPVDSLDAVAGDGAARFRSTEGGRALVLPVPLPAEVGSVVRLSGQVPDGDQLLFLHPAADGDAIEVLTLLRSRGQSAVVAVRAEDKLAGLAAVAGTASVQPEVGAPAEYGLFRLADDPGAAQDRLASGPKLGETAGGVEARGRWFEGRHGDSG